MNLILRLLLVIAAAFRKQATFGITGTSDLSLSVKGRDTDTRGHLDHTRYFSFADLGTIDYLLRSGILAALRRNGWSPIIVDKSFRHFQPLPKGETISFTTRLIGWSGHYSCLLHQVRTPSALVSEGMTIGRFVGKKGSEHPEVEDVARSMGIENPTYEPLPEDVLALIGRIKHAKEHGTLPSEQDV